MAREILGQTVTASDVGVAVSLTGAPSGLAPGGGLYLLRLRNDSGDTHAYLIPPGQSAEGTAANAVKWARVPFGSSTVTFGPYGFEDNAPLLQTTSGTAAVSVQVLVLEDGEV